MALPEKEFFRIVTPLAPAAVMEKVRSFTAARGNWAKGKKIYLGNIGKDSFEITRRIERQMYKSGLPLVPWLKFMPKFLSGKVRGENDKTSVDMVINAKSAVTGVYIQALTFALFPIVLTAILFVTLPIIFYLMGMKIDFGKLFAVETAAKIVPQLFSIIGGVLGVVLVLFVFNLFSISSYKKYYAETAAFEKQALAALLEGEIEN